MTNPIVDFTELHGVIYGKKKDPAVEVFLADLAAISVVNNVVIAPPQHLIDALYKSYPTVRIGIRRALLVLEKRRQPSFPSY